MNSGTAMIRLAVFLCVLVYSGIPQLLAHEGHEHHREDYSSEAGFIIGTYIPQFDMHTPQQMADAANAFLNQLSPEQRKLVMHDLQSPERQKWTNRPARGDVGGLNLGQLSKKQLLAFCDLLSRVVSEQGYKKVLGIMLGDDLRSFVNSKRNQGVGIGSFHFVLFGSPAPDTPWGLQLDGHHLALNISIDGENLTMSPSFFGTRPDIFTIGNKKTRPMKGEVEDAFNFLAGLDKEQQQVAILGKNRGQIRSGPGTDGKTPEAQGLRCNQLSSEQQTLFKKLVANWINTLPPVHAKRRMTEIMAEISNTRFAWQGGTTAKSDISYAIVGPTIVIEFAYQDLGGNPLDHLHSKYRNPQNEYGKQIEFGTGN